jgi:streptomycin 6-kinase
MNYDHDAHQALLQRSMHRVHIPHDDEPPPEDEALSAWSAAVFYAAVTIAAIVGGVIATLYQMGPGL